jgi:hypothetical protein
MSEIASAIRRNSFVENPLFNAYFFRAAQHILDRYATPPFLVLEHRVDAARRLLASAMGPDGEDDETRFLARTLLALVETGPVARIGHPKAGKDLFHGVEQNVAVYAIACITLLFAEEGKPTTALDEDQFFAVVGALIEPRLRDIENLVNRHDIAGLARELADIKAIY